MFDLGWSELLVIGIVALIVVGPKDLPVMFRNLGRMVGQAKSMAREFTSAMNAAADEAGVKDIQRDLNAVANPRKAGLDAIQKAAESMENWDPDVPEPPASGDASDKAGETAPKAAAPSNAATAAPAEATDTKTT